MRMLAAAAVGAVCLIAVPATAQRYPSKPIKILVGFPPGGGADQVARILDACQREGVARHRPLRDEDFVTLAVAGGARPL